MKAVNIVFGVLFIVAIVFSGDAALARDLAEALNAGQSMLNKIGIAGICLGITAGGILYSMGLAQLGRMILTSGLIGAVFILGGPAVLTFFGKMFGVSL